MTLTGPLTADLAELLAAVLHEHPGVTLADILGPSRLKPIAMARHHLAFDLLASGKSLPVVGRLLGRDHTSILNSRRAWARAIGIDDPGPTKAPVRGPYRHPSTVHGGGT